MLTAKLLSDKLSEAPMHSAISFQDCLDCFHALLSAEPATLQGVYERVRDERREELVLRFNTKCLRFTANLDDNTMMVRCEDASSLDTLEWTCLDCKEPWQSLIASSFGGGWVTINQQGSCDGVLLSFNGMQPTIMLGVVGSSLTINRIIDEHDAAKRSFLAGRPALLAEREHKPVPPFEIPYPSPRRASLRPREQVFRNPWAKRVSDSPGQSGLEGDELKIEPTGISRPSFPLSIKRIGRTLWFIVAGAFACALVGAVGSVVGSPIGEWLGEKFPFVFSRVGEFGLQAPLCCLGLLIGAVMGTVVGANREQPVRLGLCGAVLGALGSIVSSSVTTGRPIDTVIGWAVLGGITGGSYCAFLTLLEGSNGLASKTGSVARMIAYILVGTVCSMVVGALSYVVGNLIGMRLQPGSISAAVIDPFATVCDKIGWGWIGAAVGTIVGVSVGAFRQKPVGLGFLGAILGGLVFIIANPRTTSSVMDGLISWAVIAGIGGLIACSIAGFARALKKRDGDAEE